MSRGLSPGRIPGTSKGAYHFLGDLDSECAKWVFLLLRHSPHAGRDVILRRQIFSDYRPPAATSFHSYVADDRLSILQAKTGA